MKKIGLKISHARNIYKINDTFDTKQSQSDIKVEAEWNS